MQRLTTAERKPKQKVLRRSTVATIETTELTTDILLLRIAFKCCIINLGVSTFLTNLHGCSQLSNPDPDPENLLVGLLKFFFRFYQRPHENVPTM